MELAVYGFHDASICIKDRGEYFIYEFERFAKKRYAALTLGTKYLNQDNRDNLDLVLSFYNFIKKEHDINNIDICFHNEMCDEDLQILNSVFNVKKFKKFCHHYAHAACAFNQSGFDSSHIITYDGDGLNENDELTSFVYWQADSQGIRKIVDFQPAHSHSLGSAYIVFTKCLASIKSLGLPNAGKLMALSSFGKPREAWKNAFEKYFDSGLMCDVWVLSDELGFNVDIENLLTGQFELDFAATIQWAFENKFFKIFHSLNIPMGSNICLSGGCALNILVNQKLQEMGYNVFVPPNSSDCGLSFGILSDHHKDKNLNIVYRGFDILDKNYTDDNFVAKNNSLKDLAKLLYSDKLILGFVEGRSECGPRALGHRSILCYPDQLGLKDKINKKIKFREWYRPFAAIVRLEDVDKFFECAKESPYMNFCPVLKEKYRYESISHIDNTCRVQTVTPEQNSLIYNLLTEIENQGGEPILLNTSFNIKGKPILTTLQDAYECLYQTELDGFYYNGNVIFNKHVRT